MKFFRTTITAVTALTLGAAALPAKTYQLLNVSYDPTRELYVEFNKAFSEHFTKETGDTVRVQQSPGGAGKQARAAIDGPPAPALTLAPASDIDQSATPT